MDVTEFRKQDRSNLKKVQYPSPMFKGQQLGRAVYEEFYGPILPGYDVHHIDGNRNNNDISNLILLSHDEHHKIHSGNHEKTLFGWNKWCSGCKKWLPVNNENFSITTNGSGRKQFRYKCKKCRARE